MPNWCSGRLIITGDVKRLKEFILIALNKNTDTKEVLDANSFIPYPKKWKEMDKIDSNKSFNLKKEDKKPKFDGCDNGFDWCCKMWGSMWGFCSSECFDKDLSLL